MTITQEDLDHVEECGRAYARSMFETMRDTKAQGDKFRWGAFPRLVGRIAYAGLFMCFADDPQYYDEYNYEEGTGVEFREDLKALAKEVAEKEAQRLMDEELTDEERQK